MRLKIAIALLAILSATTSIAAEFTPAQRAWWAIQPVVDPPVPGAGNAIDAFVEKKRSGAELTAAPQASPQEFVRRAYFDLHGLPPTPEQVTAFALAWGEDSDAAVEGLIDELLASPRYGERWAQHWLDVVRYAESDGYREDAFRPNAYRYRDYVIRAFNSDKPYDQFVREQLAADEFAAHDPQTVEATGFLRLGMYEWNQRNAEMQRELVVNEITDLTGEVFLGVGIGCARCHDHKFDPLLQRDYFALQAFLSSTIFPDDRRLGTRDELARHREWELPTISIRAEMDAMLADARRHEQEKHVKTFPPNVQEMYWKPEVDRSSYEQSIAMLVQRQVDREEANVDATKTLAKEPEKLARYNGLKAELAALKQSEPKLPVAFIATDTGTAPAITYMGSGEKRQAVEPGYLALLGAPQPNIQPNDHTTGRRSALAKWIASTDNPLAARVAVNRIWQHHFGKGLAASPNDFGTLGEPPSHPELLDWLATRFVENGWRMKPLHRLIMTSKTYRQSARREPGERELRIDDDNRLLWRYPPTRLSAEQVRDAMLAASGELRHRDGGPSVNGDSPHRSIYVKKVRNTPEPFLHSFDAPAGFDSAPERQLTTTPTQALLLANNDWPMARARAFAKRLDPSDPIRQAYRIAWGREASDDEVELAEKFIAQHTTGFAMKKPEPAPLKFPNETGLRPISQNFSKVEGIEFGKNALWLQPGSRFERLHLLDAPPEGDTFTVEAIAQIDGVHRDASVNTLVSRWNGDHHSPGWSIGVTSEKSAYQPRNFIVQLIGENPGGDLEYGVVASDLRVPTGRPVLLRASIEPRKVTFTIRDLSDPKAEEQSAIIEHNLESRFVAPDTKLLVGGRDQKNNSHLWDGQLAKLSIDNLTLTFTETTPPPGSAWLKLPAPTQKHDPAGDAMADFCHALLSSNEFLYLH